MSAESTADARFVLVVDGACGPCSSLGREIADLTDLDVVPVSVARSRGWIVGTEVGPFLTELHGDIVAARWSGWSMRLRLARLLGARRANRWLGLLHAEYRARDLRQGRGLSRRTVIMGSLAGMVGAGTVTQVAAADAGSGVGELYEKVDESAAVGLLKESSAAREVTDRLGAIEYGKIAWDGDTIFVVKHSTESLSFVPMAAPAAGVTITPSAFNKNALSVATHYGRVLFDVANLDSEPRIADVPQPRGVDEFYDCMVLQGVVIAANSIADCLDKCAAGAAWCALCLGPSFATAIGKCWSKLFS